MEASNAQPAPISPQPAPKPLQTAAEQLSHLDQEELARFLILIRDSYPKADMANLFLEQNCKEPTVNVAALANLRDVLSHFSTFLRNGLTIDKRKEQVTNATEHLRRAILEPYELTYRDNANHFRPLFQQYVEELLPAKDQHAFLTSAPTRHNVESRLYAINEYAKKGRLAKGNNDWIPDWEEGIAWYIKAFKEMNELVHEVEEHWYKFQQEKKEANRQRESAEAFRRIEEAEKRHAAEIINTKKEIAKSHKHTVRLHYFGIAAAFVLFLFGDYQFHLVTRFVEFVTRIWHAVF